MEESSANGSSSESKSLKSLYSIYSNYLLNRLRQLFPISLTFAETSKSTPGGMKGSSRRRLRKTGLPLPLPSVASAASFEGSSAIKPETCKIFDLLEDIIEQILLNLHCIQKNLGFWKSKAEGSNGRVAYFMICERGPSAFLDGTLQIVHDALSDGYSIQKLYQSAYSYVSKRISVFSSLRYFLSTFLAKFYTEVETIGEDLMKDPENSLPSLLVSISDLFSELEASIGHLHANGQTDSDPLTFSKLNEVKSEGFQWTESETRDAINLIYENLHRLDCYLDVLISKHRKPRKLTLYWIPYSCGAFGISLFSLWLLRHSKFMGSSDLDNWARDAKESTKIFWNDHVEQPIIAIRDELFETFRKRQKGVMEREEVQLTADSLHRMLHAFSEQTVGKTLPENTSDQEMLEIVMARYQKEDMHPIQGLVIGELVRGLLIQVQKLKLDIEKAMLELDQILSNEINFALVVLLGMVVRAWFKQYTRAEGRGRIQRRLLLREIERAIMQCQICRDQGLHNDAESMYGLALCFLDSLHCVVERHARATGEWICLRQDIVDLAKPRLPTQQKLSVADRMETVYDCLLPA